MKIYPAKNLSNLSCSINSLAFNNQKLQHELDRLKRLVFGPRHEQFAPATSAEQLALGLNTPETARTVVTSVQNIQYIRTITQIPKKESLGCRM